MEVYRDMNQVRVKGSGYYFYTWACWPVCPSCSRPGEWMCSYHDPARFCLAWRCNSCEYDVGDAGRCDCPWRFDEEGEWRVEHAEAVKPDDRRRPPARGVVNNGDTAVSNIDRFGNVELCNICHNGVRLSACSGIGQRGTLDGNVQWPWPHVCDVWRCSHPTCEGHGDSKMHHRGEVRCKCAALGDFVVLHSLKGAPELNGVTGFVLRAPHEMGMHGRSIDRYP